MKPLADNNQPTLRPRLAEGQIAWRHKLLYGMGYLSVALTTDMTLTWLLKRYRPDPADIRWNALTTAGAFALAMIVGRIMDAVADPLVGFWSDRVRSRWGQRKPFIFIGAPFLAVMFVLIWIPPTTTESVLNGVYLAVTASVFFFCFTVVVCPYLAMLPEITSDPAERVRLTTWQGGFNILGAVGGMLIAGYLIEAVPLRIYPVRYVPFPPPLSSTRVVRSGQFARWE